MARGATGISFSQRAPALAVFTVAVLLAMFVGIGVGRDDPPVMILLGLVGFGAAILAARLPQLALVGVVVVTFANLSDVLIRYHGLPSLNKLMTPGLMFILGYRYLIIGERPFSDRTVIALMLGFLLLILVGAQIATRYEVALAELDEAARNMLLVLLALAFFRQRGALDAFGAALVACALVLGGIAAYKYSLGNIDNPYWGLGRTGDGGSRLSGPEADPNGFGSVLVVMLPFTIDRALWGRSRGARLLGLVAAGLAVAMILFTQSRGALVSALFSGALYAFSLDRRTALRLAVAAAVTVTVVGAILSQEMVERFASILEMAETGEAADRAVEGRLGSWMVAVRLFMDNPVLGVGAGNFNVLYQDTANELGLIFRGRDRSPHSLYLEVLSEFGLVGFLLFMTAIALAARGVLRAMAMLRARGEMRLRALCAAFGMALAGHLAAMAFLHGPGARPLWMLLAIGIALPRIVMFELADKPPRKLDGPETARAVV